MTEDFQTGGIAFRREISIRHKLDVFVAGGGPAGVAAVSAARQDRNVFLAKGHSCFGGTGTAGLMALAFMGFKGMAG